jgi:hypothetical protein
MTTPQEKQLCAKRNTAYFAKAAHELTPNLPMTAVRIQYVHHAYNTYRKRHEALYHCYEGHDFVTGYLGTWYENALERFDQ